MRVRHAASEHSPGCSCASGHLPIAEGLKSVHPMGQFINHSTHSGFSSPPICSLTGLELRSIVASLALPMRQSRAVGVAYRAAASFKLDRLPLRLCVPL